MSIKTKAPGSLMLMGEHAVLRGKHAIVQTIDKYIQVELIKRSDDIIQLHSKFGKLKFHKDDIQIQKPWHFVLSAIQHYQTALNSGFELYITSDISDTKGFASSAAVTVATVKALEQFIGNKPTLNNLFQRAKSIVKQAQGGVGSGADIAAGLIDNGTILFRAEPLVIQKLKHNPQITSVYSGKKIPTPEVIKIVANKFADNHVKLNKIDRAIDATVLNAAQAINTQNWYKFATCLQENQVQMQKLGVCNQNLQNIINSLENRNDILAAKISGSGLGDSVIGLLRQTVTTSKQFGKAFAPSNIALVKYWGKRDLKLNLPLTGSLSISLGDKGATTKISHLDCNATEDFILLNNKKINNTSSFAQKLTLFLNRFRPKGTFYNIETTSNIPIAAGLASSACGFAALVLALNDFYDWQLADRELSVLARLGSGSASRSIWQGFVEWHRGELDNGSDSFAEPLDIEWPELSVKLLIISNTKKKISSREAMQITTQTSKLYKDWPALVKKDLQTVKTALKNKDFSLLGITAENNALAMHATMIDSSPAIIYSTSDTLKLREKVWQCRKEGLEVYFTQDAGPNLKLLYLKKDQTAVDAVFGS